MLGVHLAGMTARDGMSVPISTRGSAGLTMSADCCRPAGCPREKIGLLATTGGIGACASYLMFWPDSGLPACGVELQEGDDRGDHPFCPAWTPRREFTAQG